MVCRRPARSAAPFRASGPARRSLQILLIALGLLVAQGPMLLHLLLVPHTTCEHGELVEGHAPAAPVILRAARERPETPAEVSHQGSRAPQVDAAAAGDPGHEHCDATALRHRPSELGVFIAEASLLDIAPAVSLDERGEARPVPLLSLAPKSSPPAA